MEWSYTALFDAIADSFGDREALVWRSTRQTFAQTRERANRLANVLADAGVGLHGDPEAGPGHESPHDHVALYLRNGNAYLESMLGAWRARAAATNVNYRYVDDELTEVLADQRARVIVYHGAFAETLSRVLHRIEAPRLLLRVDDGSGDELLDGAVDYEVALAGASGTHPPRTDWSPADRYILYTGGTTGSPKGVLWRQSDFMVRALGLVHRDGTELDSIDEVLDRARAAGQPAVDAHAALHARGCPLERVEHLVERWRCRHPGRGRPLRRGRRAHRRRP